MKRIDTEHATVDNFFTEGDPGTGVPATEVGQDFLNVIQEEVAEVCEFAGLTLDQDHDFNGTPAHDTTQLRQAIQHIANGTTAAAGNNLADVATTTYTLVTTKKVVPFDTTSGAKECVLPVATSVPGEEWLVGVRTGANPLNFTGVISGETNPSIDTIGTFRRLKSLGAGGWIWSA